MARFDSYLVLNLGFGNVARELRDLVLVREGNEMFFTRVWKLLRNRRVLKLWG